MISDFFALSLNNMKRKKLRSWLTMIGIFIGIASVVSLISLGNGLKTAVTGQFSTLSTDILILENSGTGFGPPGSTVVTKLNNHDLEIVKSVKGIKLAVPRIIRVVKLEYNKIARFGYITNIPDDENQKKFVYDFSKAKIEDGRLLESKDRKKIIIGNDYTNENMFEKSLRNGVSLKIQGEEFKIVGVLKKASSFQINQVIFMPEKDLKEILNIKDEIDLIAIQVENENNIEDIAKEISKELRQDRNEKEGEEDFSVQTPLQAISTVNTILTIINAIISGIAAISLIVGGVGIANTMYTSVLERTKEIGTMKAIGAKNSDIMLIFLIESGLLGLIGGLIGVVFGVLLAYTISYSANSYFNENIIKINFSILLLVGALSFSFFIGIISGIMPARRASKMKPAEALRS